MNLFDKIPLPRHVALCVLVAVWTSLCIADDKDDGRAVKQLTRTCDVTQGLCGLRVTQNDVTSVVRDQNGSIVITLPEFHYVSGVIRNSAGTCLVLQVKKVPEGGNTFAFLVRLKAKPRESWDSAVSWNASTNLFQGDRWGLVELGAMDDEGEVVLAKFVRIANDGSVSYFWQSRTFATLELTGEGLRVN